MDKAIYVCTGGCGGKVSEEEYEAGKQTCGAQSCPNFGKPFERRLVCEECGMERKPEAEHKH